jgi:hypothetical protein
VRSKNCDAPTKTSIAENRVEQSLFRYFRRAER